MMWRKLFRRGGADDSSVIGAEIEIHGQIRGRGRLEIRGRVEGDIAHDGSLYVTAEATCIGDIEAVHVRLGGTVHGNIRARERLELLPTGRLYGDALCGSLEVQPGALFQGRNRMGDELETAPRTLASLPELSAPLAILCSPIDERVRAALLDAPEPEVEAEPAVVLVAEERRDERPFPVEVPAFHGGFFAVAMSKGNG